MARNRRQLDVRHHALVLRAVARWPVELREGDLQGSKLPRLAASPGAREVHELLNGSLAMGASIAHDNPALIILQGSGKNLTGAGAELAGQHHQRPRPVGAFFAVVTRVDLSVQVLDEHHGACIYKQARQRDGLRQRSASIHPQVDDHGLNSVRLELPDDPRDIARCALEVLHAAPGGGHVHVEAGQDNNPDLEGGQAFSPLDLKHLAMGLAVGENHLGPHDSYQLGTLAVGMPDLELDPRAFLAANELHDIGELHVQQVHEVLGVPLGHRENLILRLQPSIARRRAAGNDLVDHRVAIDRLQRSPDPLELQAHADLEILEGVRRHVGCMRVIGHGRRGQKDLQQLHAIGLAHADGEVLVELDDLVARLLHRLAIDELLQEQHLHSLAPEVGNLLLA